MQERTIGYTMLIVGILVMAVSVFFVYLVLTNQVKVFEVFKGDVIQTTKQQPATLQQLMSDPSAITQMQSQLISQILEKQINKSMNLGVTIFFTYFIMLFGFRLSTLGVQLVRPIQVKLNSANTPPKPPLE